MSHELLFNLHKNYVNKVRVKLSAVKDIVEGKDIILVDDSIVRGTTSKRIVRMLKDAGANKIHVRIASPEFMFPSFYGIDVSTTAELISANKSPEEICEYIGADSLAYLSVEGLIESIGLDFDAPYSGLCVESFTGDYPAGLFDYEENYLNNLSTRQKNILIIINIILIEREIYMSKAYEQSGVDIHAGYEAVERMSSHVQRTMRKEVLGGLGGFGATFDLSQLNMKTPVLVSGTDGVGTKLKLAIDHNKHDTIGIDAVAMCVNDILTTGAEPLYF